MVSCELGATSPEELSENERRLQQSGTNSKKMSVQDWIENGLVHVGVALPEGSPLNNSRWIRVQTSVAPMRVLGIGSGFFFDRRGYVFTAEHVRGLVQHFIKAAADNGFPDGTIVCAPYVGGETDWSLAWKCSVLAYTRDWNTTNAHFPGDPIVPRMNEVRDASELFADAAVLRPTHQFASGAPIQEQDPLMLLPTSQRLEPASVPVMQLAKERPQVGEDLWALGFPQLGGSSPTPVRGEASTTLQDQHGEWLKFAYNIMPGHSGGPVVNRQGCVVAWIVRDRSEGQDKLAHFRFIAAGRPCIDAALARSSSQGPARRTACETPHTTRPPLLFGAQGSSDGLPREV